MPGKSKSSVVEAGVGLWSRAPLGWILCVSKQGALWDGLLPGSGVHLLDPWLKVVVCVWWGS